MTPYKVLVIGASAGGVSALRKIVAGFEQKSPPWPVLIVQHMKSGMKVDFHAVFSSRGHLNIVEAEDKMRPNIGHVYFAPPGYHLLLEEDGLIALSTDSPVNFSRPSIDVLFETAGDAYGRGVMALLLTGANHDGAAGIKYVKERGGLTLVQNPETAEFPRMPGSALALGPVDHVMDLDAIIHFLRALSE